MLLLPHVVILHLTFELPLSTHSFSYVSILLRLKGNPVLYLPGSQCELVDHVPFLRGDANDDGKLSISDAITSLSYQFRGGLEPSCLKSLDTNDSGGINFSDATVLLNYLFSSGPSPSSPVLLCGLDRTPDSLGCRVSSACE